MQFLPRIFFVYEQELLVSLVWSCTDSKNKRSQISNERLFSKQSIGQFQNKAKPKISLSSLRFAEEACNELAGPIST